MKLPDINWNPMRLRASAYARLMRLDKPIGIFLLLWPTLWALWLAGAGSPPVSTVVVFVVGVVLMRSAGCVINDYADRDIDPHVERTRKRPLAAGEIPPHEALLLFALLCLVAFALVLTQNLLTIKLSFIAALLAATYPFAKRFHHLPQVHLGAAFAMAIPMSFAAVQNTVPPLAWLVFITALLWTVAYDTMYAMADREDDRKIGVKSTAILFGDLDKPIIGLLQVTVLLGLYLIGQRAELGNNFHFALLIGTGFAAYQQWLIRERRPAPCFRAFLNNNGFGLVIFIGIVWSYAARG